MFKAVISRDGGEPWGPTGMTTRKWLQIRPQYPHVIRWRGDDYLEDGHHRVMRGYLLGYTHMRVRVLHVPDNPLKKVAP